MNHILFYWRIFGKHGLLKICWIHLRKDRLYPRGLRFRFLMLYLWWSNHIICFWLLFCGIHPLWKVYNEYRIISPPVHNRKNICQLYNIIYSSFWFLLLIPFFYFFVSRCCLFLFLCFFLYLLLLLLLLLIGYLLLFCNS